MSSATSPEIEFRLENFVQASASLLYGLHSTKASESDWNGVADSLACLPLPYGLYMQSSRKLSLAKEALEVSRFDVALDVKLVVRRVTAYMRRTFRHN